MTPPASHSRSRAVAGVLLILSGACAAVLALAACSGASSPAAPAQAAPIPGPPDGLEYVPPAPGSYELPPIGPAADGVVVDADGTSRRLFDYLGDRYVLLSFIYTHCTAVQGCLLATGSLAMVKEALTSEPDLAKRVRLISLSFDPDRDSPAVMRRYAEEGRLGETKGHGSIRDWSFLTTASRVDLAPILEGYGQSILREVDALGRPTGNLSHVLKVFLIDHKRRVRNIYSTAFLHPAVVINDVKTLWLEDGRP
jgi:cytochrome c peroxidase